MTLAPTPNYAVSPLNTFLRTAQDLELNAPLTCFVFGGSDDDPRAHGAGVGIDLRLGKIEQVLPFNVARTHTLEAGDLVRITISGVGTLENPVAVV